MKRCASEIRRRSRAGGIDEKSPAGTGVGAPSAAERLRAGHGGLARDGRNTASLTLAATSYAAVADGSGDFTITIAPPCES